MVPPNYVLMGLISCIFSVGELLVIIFCAKLCVDMLKIGKSIWTGHSWLTKTKRFALFDPLLEKNYKRPIEQSVAFT